ncbi:cytochrome c [Paucibacter sp. TC2R-5]|uniref:c-type cytochrome n=1 Tax=Paucibacter sp. TC2R-5 TaxID=2893555 RepID=UPI0021E433AD|nr:cytochrome c [Paucibacter sp. TC2R-5]MCV2359427.1 cytochrome c [Paucibacter sp. TC2R-5]
MKARLLAVALLAALALAGAVVYGLNHLDEAAPTQSAAATSPAMVERGAYLARAGNCMGCHTQRGGAPYAGGRALPTPFGDVFAPNLTPDPATGLGQWTSNDFWAALHNGRSKDGRLLTPAFPYTNYALVTREDADALFAYLQSLPAVAQANRAHELRFPYNTQPAMAVWRALYFRPAVFKPDAGRSAEWNRGAYLTQGLGHCNACHAPRNSLGATPAATDFSGGMLAPLAWYAPSLHDPAEAGVADWPAQDLRQWLKTGSSASSSALGPMGEVILGSTQFLNEADLAAMATYLQSLPQHAAAKSTQRRPEPALRELGKALYADHCARCHGEQGEGVKAAYPALAGSRSVQMQNPANLLRIIQRGGFAPATAGNPRPYGMPPFAGILSDTEQAALASFVRNAWGNQAADVRPLDVLQLKTQRVN